LVKAETLTVIMPRYRQVCRLYRFDWWAVPRTTASNGLIKYTKFNTDCYNALALQQDGDNNYCW